jgi:hypothetical protein
MDNCPGRAMNATHITYCELCGDCFMMVGNTPIRMGQWRMPDKGKNGYRTGACPKHRMTRDLNPRIFR